MNDQTTKNPESPVKIKKDLVVIPSTETPAERSIEKRRLRKHFILNVIREHGPLSRADISKVSGYNLRSISSLVDELVTDGLVIEDEAIIVPRGRRPTPVHLDERAAAALGIDVGRGITTGLMMDLGGGVISEIELSTPDLKSADEYSEWLKEVASQVFEKAEKPMPPLCGIGVGLPGLVAKKGIRVAFPLNEIAQSIQKDLNDTFGVEVFIDNDARMMALGSLWFGQGKDYNSFAVLKLGIGLGMGLIEEGRSVQGSMGFASELGHLPMGESGVQCRCGNVGCLENLASGTGIARLAREKGLGDIGAREVAELARKGNEVAQEIYNIFADALARGIAAILNMHNPQAVILSGRLVQSADVFFEETKRRVEVYTLPNNLQGTEILLAEPSARLGPRGAGAVVLHHIFYSAHVQVRNVI